MNTDFREKIKAANDWPALCTATAALRADALTSRDADLVYRALSRCDPPEDLRVALATGYTAEPLNRYVAALAAADAIGIREYLVPFGQYFQSVLDTGSELCAFNPNLIFFNVLLRELAPALVFEHALLADDERAAMCDDVVERVGSWAAAAARHTDATIVIANFPGPVHPVAGIADGSMSSGESAIVQRINAGLVERFESDARVAILDLNAVCGRFGQARAWSPRMYHLAKMPWAEDFMPHVAHELVRYVRALCGRTRKCLVLDLDNTLWGGVLGEDGPHGIEIGPGSPRGEAFFEFQQAVRSLAATGVILAICSKNNHDDVVAAFEARKDMPLSLQDFAAMAINWDDKPANVLQLAEQLNIGVDSMVFVDDSPMECTLVRGALPDVHTMLLDGDPSERASMLLGQHWFDKLAITNEDRQKTQQYREQAGRTQSRESAADLTSFLHDLETVVTIRTPAAADAARVHQLFTKTNQFNLTTQRYKPAEIDGFLKSKRHKMIVIDAEDRHGALGTIGVILLEVIEKHGRIDSFVLSCRALGRHLETAVMNWVKQVWLERGELDELGARYLKTAKNAPAEMFFENQGFGVQWVDGDDKYYALQRADATPIACDWIRVIDEGDMHGE